MSQGNPDIRNQVEANRGGLKKLQLLIPGLRGYRSKEDIRVSDEMLRNQVADHLDNAKTNLEGLRKQIATASDLSNLTTVGSVISQVQGLSGQIRHAAQGYSGFVAPIQMGDDKLNSLYDYDYSVVSSVFQLEETTSPENMGYDAASPNNVQTKLGAVSNAVSDIKAKWKLRMDTIQGVALK